MTKLEAIEFLTYESTKDDGLSDARFKKFIKACDMLGILPEERIEVYRFLGLTINAQAIKEVTQGKRVKAPPPSIGQDEASNFKVVENFKDLIRKGWARNEAEKSVAETHNVPLDLVERLCAPHG